MIMCLKKANKQFIDRNKMYLLNVLFFRFLSLQWNFDDLILIKPNDLRELWLDI